MRRWRSFGWAAVGGLALVAAVATVLIVRDRPAGAKSDPCPGRYAPGEEGNSTAESRAMVLQGRFSLLGQPAVRLVPAVDWKQDPYGSKTWRSKLHSLVPVGALLGAYSRHGERAALPRARDLAIDWIEHNPPRKGFPWKDKLTGARASRIAYLTAAAQCARILTPAQRETLRDSAVQHAEFLADPDNFEGGNHALFQDLGLVELTNYLPSLPQAPEWREMASKRYRESVPIHREEYVGLEHSPGYHFVVLNQLDAFLRLAPDPQLGEMARRMRQVAPWFVMPDGSVTRLGDTSVRNAPSWAIQPSRSLRGIAPTRKSGFGIVRQEGSYLSVAAGLHPFGHKQKDELTFELFDRGRRIVTDTGRYGAKRNKRDPVRAAAFDYTLSSQAHSTLVVDGRPFAVNSEDVYGSGIEAAGQGAGWWAIEGANPLLRSQEVTHRRLFLYRPGEALVVVDRVAAEEPHRYTRYFHFDPAISARPQADGQTVALSAQGFSGTLHSSTAGQPRVRVVRGQRDPLLGFTSSKDKFAPFVPRAVAIYDARGRSIDQVAILSLQGRAMASMAPAKDGSTSVRLSRPGQRPVEVTVVRDGERLQVSQR